MSEFETSRGPMLQSAIAPGGAVTPGASPYTYTALESGVMYLSAGVVSLMQVQRPGVSLMPVGAVSGLAILRRGDKLTVTYTVAPAMNWLPL